MKFSISWLTELVDCDKDPVKLAEQLTMVGLEVAEVKPVAKNFSGVVVGEILEVNKHPNADKLTVCRVDVGSDQLLTIVCGATNVKPKLKVPVALLDAELPNNFKIKKTKLRGVESEGMMCSAVELGLAECSQGLLELPNDAPIGEDIRKYLFLDDSIIDVELTPNRGDCLSIIGIAREVAAINHGSRNKIKQKKIVSHGKSLPVVIDAQDACPHYCGCVIRGVNNKVSVPIWLKERLHRSNISSVSPIVDIANYVMLELGQPLHAFDLAKIDNRIQVRYANFGEKIVLLNGNDVELNTKTLVIADNNKILAVAGIMGGLHSSVDFDTTDIFLESAFFVPEKISVTARDYNLQTDASYRYERGVDYELQLSALNRATSLFLEIIGGQSSDIIETKAQKNLPECTTIQLHRASIKKILGISISDDEVFNILSGLEMHVVSGTDGWQITVPSWRFDISIEEDLVEEVARIYGYNRIPERDTIFEAIPPVSAFDDIDKNRLYDLMVDLGYQEVITYSFTDPKLQTLLDPEKVPLPLVNPISPELAMMRTTLWVGLINTVKYNLHRQHHRMRFFEIGSKFLPQNDSVQQPIMLAGIVLGTVYPEQWGLKQKEQVDFFDLKNDVETVIKMLSGNQCIEYKEEYHSALHPKRSAQFYVAGIPVGYLGEMHPKIKQELGINGQIYMFEIDLSNVDKKKRIFKEFSRFPKICRDISILVNTEVLWQQIRQEIVDISGELLQNINVFDVYQGEGVELNKKSVAIHLEFQSVARTLVDTEVELLVSQIVVALKQKFDAILRG